MDDIADSHTAYRKFGVRCDLTAMAVDTLVRRLSRAKKVFVQRLRDPRDESTGDSRYMRARRRKES
jgi:hypothetical protein